MYSTLLLLYFNINEIASLAKKNIMSKINKAIRILIKKK